MPVRGVDRFHNFAHVSAPDVDLSPESLAWHRRVMLAQNDAIYEMVAEADGAAAPSVWAAAEAAAPRSMRAFEM